MRAPQAEGAHASPEKSPDTFLTSKLA